MPAVTGGSVVEATAVLSYAIRPAVVGRHLGQLALVHAALSVIPLAVAIALGDPELGLRLAVTMVVLIAVGLPTLRLGPTTHLQTNEGLVVAALAFVLAPAFMTWPMMAGGLPALDAFFESVSALTTTGLTMLDRVTDRSPAFLFVRTWLQWVGGLGFAVLAVALLLAPHADTRRLTGTDTPESTSTTAHLYARRVLGVYVALTALGVVVLWAVIEDGFSALLHILSAISTGGFSAFADSLAGMPEPGGAWIVTGWCVLGATPLILYHRAASGRPAVLLKDTEVLTLLGAVTFGALLLAIALHWHNDLTWTAALHHHALLAASAQTTAGFSTLPVAMLDPTAKLIAIVAMLTGGSVGSTAGGLKLLRLLVLLRVSQFALRRTAMPAHGDGMRAVFMGASTLAIARLLLARRHEVVVIERDKDRIEALADDLQCGYIHGDGSRPAILREADPEHTTVLFCLTGSDQSNIIASLVGRSLGFPRVVTKIDDPAFEHICIELGLVDTIIPARAIGRHLADLAEGRDPLELSTMIREEARALSFVASATDAVAVDALALPSQTRVVCVYRDAQLVVPDGETVLHEGDEVVLITHRDSLDKLKANLRRAD